MTSNAGLDRIDIDESHRNAVRQNAAEIAEVAAKHKVRLRGLHAVHLVHIPDGENRDAAVRNRVKHVAFKSQKGLAGQVFRQLQFLQYSQIVRSEHFEDRRRHGCCLWRRWCGGD